MKKDAFYFPHDSNAANDPKCVLLIEQLGLEGYGIFWVLIETLRDQPNYKYPLNLIPALARRYNTTTEKMKAVVNAYQLFTIDEQDFFSSSLIRRMEFIDSKRDQNRNAALMRWHSERNADALPMHSGRNAIKEKNSKGNNSKGNNKSPYGEFKNVFLSDDELTKLKERFGEAESQKRIQELSEGIASKGYNFKNHYATILTWDRRNGNAINNQRVAKKFNPDDPFNDHTEATK